MVGEKWLAKNSDPLQIPQVSAPSKGLTRQWCSLIVIPSKRAFAPRGIWASRAKRRAFRDATMARLARFLIKLHHYLYSFSLASDPWLRYYSRQLPLEPVFAAI